MLKHLPNAMTCGNLLCGCLGIYVTFQDSYFGLPLFEQLSLASLLILVAAVLDFGDGFVARLVHATSAIGKELDSLADMVTFGVLPAFIMHRLLDEAHILYHFGGSDDIEGEPVFRTVTLYVLLLPLLLVVFSALRLAKFNVDTRQSEQFIGVPTPANAMLIASLPLTLNYQHQYTTWILNPYLLSAYIVVMSYLLVAELPLMAFKFKSFAWADNKIKYSFLIAAVALLVILKFAAIPLIILLYILLSLMVRGEG
jgi:CDP-diacylglycerol---serine O-phosphatidyltransferase